jgi:thiol-disulfide isomerase/thioredoxin
MNKKIILSLGMMVLLFGCVSAVSVDFFYSESCPHCQTVFPFMVELSENYPINFYDINKGSYDVDGVPRIRIETSDGRNIELVGSREIPQYLECELNEMSSKECPTYSVDMGCNKETQSWFIR